MSVAMVVDLRFSLSHLPQKLPPGRYAYKFIVDGVWQHSEKQPTVSDGAGGLNNTVAIEGKSTMVSPSGLHMLHSVLASTVPLCLLSASVPAADAEAFLEALLSVRA